MFKRLKNNKGATAIEYGLIAAGISIAIFTSLSYLGSGVQQTFCNVASGLNDTNGCNPVVNAFNKQIAKLESNLKTNEGKYVTAWNNLNDIISEGKDLHEQCANGVQSACSEYNTLINGSADATSYIINPQTGQADSDYGNAMNNLLDAENNLLYGNGKDITGLQNDINNLFDAQSNSNSTYQQMLNQYGEKETNSALESVLNEDIQDPDTGQQTKLSSLFSESESAKTGLITVN